MTEFKMFGGKPFLSLFYADKRIVEYWTNVGYTDSDSTEGWYWSFEPKDGPKVPYSPNGPFNSAKEATENFMSKTFE